MKLAFLLLSAAVALSAAPAAASGTDAAMKAARLATKSPVGRLMRQNVRIYGCVGWEIGRSMSLRQGKPDVGSCRNR